MPLFIILYCFANKAHEIISKKSKKLKYHNIFYMFYEGTRDIGGPDSYGGPNYLEIYSNILPTCVV